MRVRTAIPPHFAPLALAGVLAFTGCRSAEVAEREDAIRLRTFLLANQPAYRAAVEAEQAVIAEIASVAEQLADNSSEAASERLRQRVLAPKHTYKHLHDQMNAWRLTGRAGEQQRRACAHLKTRELALLRFTTLLVAIRDMPARSRDSALRGEIDRLAAAAREHTPPQDEIAPIIRDIAVLWRL